MRFILLAILTIFLGFDSMAENQSKINAHSFSFKSAIKDEEINLSNYKDKVVLIVNTASECGFTGQYANMETLWDEYKEKGLVVIAVPSNDFGGQEPGTEAQICEFASSKYDVSFPITAKYNVKGDNAHEFYKWANKEVGFVGSPKWNFHKYLIDKKGNISEWYSSPTKPDSDKIKKKIEDLIK
jgi:glutathione peroxidase